MSTGVSAGRRDLGHDLGGWVRDHFGVTLHTVSSPVDLEIRDLVGVALRRNPRRAHLLVSTVLGKHLPVGPDLVAATGRLLGELTAGVLARGELAPGEPTFPPRSADGDGGHIGRNGRTGMGVPSGRGPWPALARAALPDGDPAPLLAALDRTLVSRPIAPVLVLGFAETATGLGHLVADQMRAQHYLHSTRRAVPGVPVAGTFDEGHSHATRHLLLPTPTALLDQCDTLVLVDDELSTGQTAMGTIAAAHLRRPRARYIVASLVDLRNSADDLRIRDLARTLDCRIDVVSLVRGDVTLPDGLLGAVSGYLAHAELADPPPADADRWRSAVLVPVASDGRPGLSPQVAAPQGHTPQVVAPQGHTPQVVAPQGHTPQVVAPQSGGPQSGGPEVGRPEVEALHLPWPAAVPDGGRHGVVAADRPAFEAALADAGALLSAAVHARLASGAGHGRNPLVADSKPMRSDGAAYRVLVVGTEELMYAPLRLAQQLGLDADLEVAFQSTTRSPVLDVDDDDYPIRRQFRFVDPEGDVETWRYLYNVRIPDIVTQPDADPDLVVVVTDAAADTPALRGSDGLPAVLAASGLRVQLATLGAVDPVALTAGRHLRPPAELAGHTDIGEPELDFVARPPGPLTGPAFGSYAPDEVRWLLTDLSDAGLEADIADREAAIQAGTAHYAESLPVEFQPDIQYRQLFDSVLAGSAERLALAVGLVTELVLRERGEDIVLASLARAGTPIGILMRRWAHFHHALTLPHYALSIVRGRGIDATALRYIAGHHDSGRVVFVDGWTGKGAIALELTAALEQLRGEGLNFNADLAVLADPGHCVRHFGTRDDFLIASACLNSTVSGLVSRTVLNEKLLKPGQFHGAKFYRELAAADVSNVLLDTVAAAFPGVAADVTAGLDALADSDREPTFAGWAAIEAIRSEYGIESVNFVKPGVGETTRVLLRRVPWRILVREPANPDHAHLRLLAAQRNVPVEVREDLPYSCVGLIRRMSASEPGEG